MNKAYEMATNPPRKQAHLWSRIRSIWSGGRRNHLAAAQREVRPGNQADDDVRPSDVGRLPTKTTRGILTDEGTDIYIFGKGFMKIKLLIGLVAIAALTGCSVTKGIRVAKDGSTLAVTNRRLLWNSEGVDFTVKDTNGFAVSLSIQKSNPDAQAIGAVAEGVAKGLAKGAMP